MCTWLGGRRLDPPSPTTRKTIRTNDCDRARDEQNRKLNVGAEVVTDVFVNSTDLVTFGKVKVHSSHLFGLRGGLLWCERCGAWTSGHRA